MSDACVTKDLPIGAIRIANVSKIFRRNTNRSKSYRTFKSILLGRKDKVSDIVRPRRETFVALDSVNIHIKPGLALGIVGRNGSGKSTLLKLISGIYQPDSGSVSRRGKLSALIELGAGFHPDFSGRENIYLGGVMYGLSKREIDRKFKDIVGYAELEDYIDDPIRTYSSGMYMRLGFSLAVFTDPDILLIDEVLAVGDASFVNRCHDTISEFRRRGKTLIFVTHDLSSVIRWCDEAVWLDCGRVIAKGNPRWVIDSYLQKIDEKEAVLLNNVNNINESTSHNHGVTEGELSCNSGIANVHTLDLIPEIQPESDESITEEVVIDNEVGEVEELTRWGNGDVEILSVKMLAFVSFGSDSLDRSGDYEAKWVFNEEDKVRIEVSYIVNKPLDDLVFGIGILRADGITVHGSNTDIDGVSLSSFFSKRIEEDLISPHKGKYCFEIARLSLTNDTYFLDIAAHRSDGTPYDYHHRRYKFSVKNKVSCHGVYSPERTWYIEDVDV